MITDVEARRIASEWHGGGGSALYVLSSTGAIVLNDQGMEWLNVTDEARSCLRDVRKAFREGSGIYSRLDESDLDGLLFYIKHHGSRGPVEGWGQLIW